MSDIGVVGSNFVHLRSIDAQGVDSTPGNYKINLVNYIETPKDYTCFLSLVSAVIPTSFTQINSSNNSFTLSVRHASTLVVTTQTITLENANYGIDPSDETLQEFRDALREKLETAFPVVTFGTWYVDLDERKRLYIELNSPTYDIFNSSINTNISRVFNVPNGTYTNVVTDGNLTTLIFGVLNLMPITNIYVVLNNQFSQKVFNSQNQSSTLILANLPLDNQMNSYLYYYPSNKNAKQVITSWINSFHVMITDSDFNILDFQGLHNELTIRVDYRKVYS